jgi:hypothetical protein
MASKDDFTFAAVVSRVTTLADNGIRVAFDLPEDAVVQAAQLMELKRIGSVLKVTVEPGR